MPSLLNRFKNSWNAFLGRDPTTYGYQSYGSSYPSYRYYPSVSTLRSVVSSIYNRIAVDVAAVDFRHIRINDDGNYESNIDSYLNDCLQFDPNLDQSRQAFMIDLISSMIEEGAVAIIPTDTDVDPLDTDSYDVRSMRVGRVVEWYPYDVRLEVYREDFGRKEQIVLPKRIVPIIENPFYNTMNEQNSTSKRLIRVLNQLDRTNEQNSAGKLDMIIQLPYIIKSESRKKQADRRRQEIEEQLTGSQYGIAYADGTEKIVQLNRPLENNLWEQAKSLTSDLFNQLGVTENILNGTASEEEMVNYHDRTIRPFCTAIAEEIERKWLSKTARTQKQAIRFFRDPFKIVPVKILAEISDKFTRNEIMSSNEIRSVIGLMASSDPRADQLINANLNQPESDARIQGGNTTNVTIDE